MVQLTGYDRYSTAGVWYTWKTVATHSSRTPQAPTMDTIMGTTEYPKPRSAPTITSITPHRQYRLQTYFSRTMAWAMTSSSPGA